MKLRLAALLLVLAIPLLGAGAFGSPVVIVYPLTVSGGNNTEAGSDVAILYSTKLAQLGGIEVKPYTPGTERSQYLAAALAVGADYYVSGFMTPVGGSDVSIVTQVVSTASGAIIFSETKLAKTYGDASSEGETLHDVIVAHATRGLAALDHPAPSPTPTPLGKGGIDVGKVLHRRSAPSPAASSASAALAAPSPSATAAGEKAALLFDVAGELDNSLRTSTLYALTAAFRRVGVRSGYLPVDAAQISRAGALCQANAGASALYAPTLTLARSRKGKPLSVKLDLVGYDCNGAQFGSAHVVRAVKRGLDDALGAAANDAVASLMTTSKKL
jgi:hypothetical protein